MADSPDTLRTAYGNEIRELETLSAAAPFPIRLRRDCLEIQTDPCRSNNAYLGREMAEFVHALVTFYRSGSLVQLQADLRAAREERDTLRQLHRWNIDRTDGEVLVCRGLHEKGEDCDRERFVPEERLIAAEAERDSLRIRLQEAERALKPFAMMAEPLLSEKPHWATADAYAFRIHPGAVAVTYGDFYRAHAALATPIPATEEAGDV